MLFPITVTVRQFQLILQKHYFMVIVLQGIRQIILHSLCHKGAKQICTDSRKGCLPFKLCIFTNSSYNI